MSTLDAGSAKFYASDPIAIIALQRLRLSPWRLSLVCFGLELVGGGLQAAYAGLVTHDSGLGPFIAWDSGTRYLANLLFSLVVTPLAWGLYAWFATAPAQLLAGLRASGVFLKLSDEDTREDLEHAGRRFGARGWPIASSAIALLLAVAYVYVWLVNKGAQPAFLFIRLPLWMVSWYMVCMVVARQLVLIECLSDLFSNRAVKLNPLHPDRCGGLGPLNRYAINFTYFIATCGVGLVLNFFMLPVQLGFDHVLYAAIGVYIFLAPLVFFGTLGAAHTAMKGAKDALLRSIAERFEVDYSAARNEMAKDAAALKEDLDKMDQLKSLYRETEAFPVWPFDTRSIAEFVAAIVAPVAGTVLAPVALKLVKRLAGVD